MSEGSAAGHAVAAVVLAAGEGKRMKSPLAKVLHEVAGKPLLGHVLDRLDELGIERRVVVVGHCRAPVIDLCQSRGAETVVQEEQLGTAHAFEQAVPLLGSFAGTVLVLCGDTPLLTRATLEQLLEIHRHRQAAVTVLSADLENPDGYGRVLRDAGGDIERIVEQKDASREELRVHEINTAIYALDYPLAAEQLEHIDRDNRQGEFYLTDLVSLLRSRGERVAVLKVADPREALGVNTRTHLEEAEDVFAELRSEGRL